MPKPTIFVLATVAIAATASPAFADGIRVTAIAGLERTDSGPGAGAEDGLYYGAQVGKDWSISGLSIGIEGELGGSSASRNYTGVSAQQGLFATGTVRVAVPVSPSTRGFVRGGVAHHRIDYASLPDFSGTGYTLGAGLEQDLGGPIFLRGEYRYSDYGSQVRGQHFVAGLGLRF